MKAIDLSGQTFERLTVLNRTGRLLHGRPEWTCLCQCGNKTVSNANQLRSGHTKSCGCLQKEAMSQTGKNNLKHGATRVGFGQPLYIMWRNMKSRCNDPANQAYPSYGGRGIKVCNAWQAYEPFRDYMLSLPNCPENAEISGSYLEREVDRKNTNGNYEPGNVRWSTILEQANNRTNNRRIKVNGVEMTVANAIRKYAVVSPRIVRDRLRKGWKLRDAFLQPQRI